MEVYIAWDQRIPPTLNYRSKEKIHSLKIISNQIKDFQNKIKNKIEKEHSKINIQLPFRTDIRGEINTDNDRAIYSKHVQCSISYPT